MSLTSHLAVGSTIKLGLKESLSKARNPGRTDSVPNAVGRRESGSSIASTGLEHENHTESELAASKLEQEIGHLTLHFADPHGTTSLLLTLRFADLRRLRGIQKADRV